MSCNEIPRLANRPRAEKLALLIGINRYLHSAPPLFPNLEGCLHDVEDMNELLTCNFGFDPSRVVILRDQQATRDGILAGIRRFVASAREDDVAVFYYAGHGALVDSDARVNGTDQSIVPHDGNDPDAAILDITGAELDAEFSNIAARNTVLIFDSCFSGSMLLRSNGRARTVRSRRRHNPVMPGLRGISFRPPDAPYALLSACDQHELSDEREIDGMWRGLLTYSLTRVLRNSATALTYRDLMDRLGESLTTLGASQHPQLEGSHGDFWVFGEGQVGPTQRYLLAFPEEKPFVRLLGGRELGITAGSLYEIYPPSEKLFHADSALATIKVTTVNDFSSLAEIVSGAQPLPASRAIETEHAYESFKMRVACGHSQAPVLAQVRGKAAGLSYLSFVQDDPSYDLRVDSNAGLLTIRRAGQTDPVCIVREGPDASDGVLQQLVYWAKWLNLLRLRNPNPRLKIGFSIRPLDAHGSPASAYYDDGRVECTVTNNSGRPLYLGILDFADDGRVTLIYPVNSPPMLLDGHIIRQSFGFEKLPPGKNSASDTLKLIVTTEQRDLRILELSGPQACVRGSNDGFGQLLLQAGFGQIRDSSVAVPLPGWTTVEAELALEQRK